MTEDDDRFFARLRGEAAPLRHQVDEATLARIRLRIQERMAEPRTGVAELLAAWFRPLAAAVVVIVVAAGISIAAIEATSEPAAAPAPLEIVMAGETYRVE